MMIEATGTNEATAGPRATVARRWRSCRRLLAASAMLLAASCAAATPIPAQPPSVTASRLADDAIGLAMAQNLELLAAYRLQSPDPRFGGFSAIETDGATLWLLSDRAVLWRAALTIAEDGGLALADWTAGAILPDPADRRPLDSEALALGREGELIAGFEHDDSLRRLVPLASGGWSTERLHAGRLFDAAPVNRGIEAVASLPDGALVAFSEGARLGSDIAAGARLLADGTIERFGYRVGRGFSPVAATAAGGHLYVLERSVGLFAGWQSRLTRARLSAPPMTGTLAGEEILRITVGPLAENYEGVAVLERPGAPSLILLVADDNQSPLQRTLLLVFGYVD